MARDQRAYSRRSFCWTLASVLVAPGLAIAQTSKTIRRIGVLEPGSLNGWGPGDLSTQAEALRELGWVEGQNLHIESRYANGRSEALPHLAEELVRAQVEIIVTAGTPATLAAKSATTTIPIVFRVVADPVLVGLVATLARPGGNVTGYSDAGPETTAKQLSLLKELLPRIQGVGMLWPAGNPYSGAARSQFEQVCQSLGLRAISVEIAAEAEIVTAIAQLVRLGAQVMVLPDSLILIREHRSEIFDAATKRGLPIMSDEPTIAREAGALIAYGTTFVEQCRRRAEYIDRILRGAKPSDLPVQQPTKFELAINLKTARALRLTIPQSLLLRADELIE